MHFASARACMYKASVKYSARWRTGSDRRAINHCCRDSDVQLKQLSRNEFTDFFCLIDLKEKSSPFQAILVVLIVASSYWIMANGHSNNPIIWRNYSKMLQWSIGIFGGKGFLSRTTVATWQDVRILWEKSSRRHVRPKEVGSFQCWIYAFLSMFHWHTMYVIHVDCMYTGIFSTHWLSKQLCNTQCMTSTHSPPPTPTCETGIHVHFE